MGLPVEEFLVQDCHPTSVFGLSLARRVDLNIGPTLEFPAGIDRYMYWPGKIRRQYNLSGWSYTVRGHCGATGNIILELAFERHEIGVTDLSLLTNFQPGVTAVLIVPTANFQWSVTFNVSHAQMGSPLGGESYRLRLGRLGTNGLDTSAGSFYYMAMDGVNQV